ncbi:MAG: biotin/lipoate--protein ligase family protein [Pseudomonadota bacterium]
MNLAEPVSFPPLLSGEAVAPGQPFARAMAKAALGTDPGLVTWAEDGSVLEAALVLAPEVALRDALPVSMAVGLGLADALGALAPPEVAVHFEWPGTVRVNGARCGRLRAAANTADPDAEPDWLVIGLEMRFVPPPQDDPGRNPEETWLHEEGCAEITPRGLLESWSRHALVWINTWTDRGLGPVHEAWRGKTWGLGEPLPGTDTVFLGLDEHGGQLLRSPEGTTTRPLTDLLEAS